MANELMNPGPPDAPSGYGSPGAAAYYGLQQELLRRAMLARQQQQDELDRQRVLQEIDASKENVKTSRVQREAAASANTERANKLGLEQATTGLTPGTDLSPDQKRAIVRFGGSGLVKSTPGIANEVSSAPVVPLDQMPPAPAPTVVSKDTYKGTADQQILDQHRTYAQKIVDGLNAKKDNGDELTPLEQEQLYEGTAILMTGKSATAPAGVIVPKKGSAEKLADVYQALKTKELLGKVPLTAEESAQVKAYEAQHPTEAQKQRDAILRIDVTQSGANKRQTSTQTFQTKQQFRRELTDNEKTVDKDIERSDRALFLLNSPNFVTDAVAGPEFLQIVAGGMGSGLRMTDAELNRINEAQTKIDQFKGQLAKWDVLGIGDRRTIQNEMRAQMKAALDAVHAARQRKAALAESTLQGLEDADTQDEIDTLHSKYWSDKRTTATMSGGGAPAGGGLPSGVTVTKRTK